MNHRNLLGLMLAASLSVAAPVLAQTPTPYDGLKKTISVDLFQATEAVGGTVTAEGMTAMLVDALVRDGRFVVVERPALAGVQAEQALSAGSVNAETAAPTGGLIGSSAIIRGAVTKYDAAAGGSSLNVGGLPMGLGQAFAGRAGVKTQKAVMTIALRMIDTTSGQVISTSKAEGSARSSQAEAGLVDTRTGATAGANSFRNTPIGKAGEDAIAKAVEQIAAGMRNVPWSALVVDASSSKIYVNAGADRNVQPGIELHVYRKGRTLTDPSTGVVLDVEMENVGVVRIDTVRDRLSTASVVSGGPPARGDILKLD